MAVKASEEPDDRSRAGDSEILRLIYEAALTPGGWQNAMKAVGDRVGATSGYLFSAPEVASPAGVAEVYGVPLDMVREHFAHWHQHDPWKLGAIRLGKMRRGTIVLDDELLPHAGFLKTAFFNDFSRRYDMERLLGTVLYDGHEAEGMPFTNLCWYRPPGHEGFDPAAKATIRDLLPHFQQALRLRKQVRAVSDASASSTLSNLRMACIFLDGEQRVVQANEAGVALLQSSARGAIRHGRVQHRERDALPAWRTRNACARQAPRRVCWSGWPVTAARWWARRWSPCPMRSLSSRPRPVRDSC